MKRKLLPGQRLFTPAERGIVDVHNRPIQKAKKWNVGTLTTALKSLKQKATMRMVEGGELTASWCDEAIENINTEDYMKEKGEAILAASKGDRESAEMIAESIAIVTTNFVTADTCWMPFFRQSSLADGDNLVIQTDQPGQRIQIDGIGQDGGRISYFAQPEDPTPVFVPIHMRSTPWIEYALRDLYKGSVKDMALMQFDLARDRAERQDQLASSYILTTSADTRYIANFVTTGAQNVRDIYAHPGVVLANLPTGNLITLSGNTTSSLFRKEVYDAIIEYVTSWGSNALEAGSMMPVEIIVASKHMTDFLKQVSFGLVPGFTQDQVFEGGALLNYAGYRFVIKGVNTLSPTHGRAYVRMNLPIGEWADKPGFAEDIVDNSPALRTQNKERMCSQWAESIALPLHWRKNTLCIIFRTAS
jgi:hypothetical protein